MLRTALSLSLVALSLLASCGGGRYVVEGGENLVLLTNLHPDHRRVVYSVNYTSPPRGELLPVCTPVSIDRVTAKEIVFTAKTSGMRYRYRMHRSTRVPVDQHVQRYFGAQCPSIAAMTPEDQAGVQQGQVFQGMTKQGVIVALGYPPEHRTPTLEADVWRYWQNKMGQFEVYFTGGVVSGIRQ